MKLEKRDDEHGFTLISLAGRLDLEGTEAIDLQFATVAGHSTGAIVVDLREVSFLASIGMRMFVTAAKTLRRNGHRLVLLGPQESVRRALDVAGLTPLLTIAEDYESARALAHES